MAFPRDDIFVPAPPGTELGLPVDVVAELKEIKQLLKNLDGLDTRGRRDEHRSGTENFDIGRIDLSTALTGKDAIPILGSYDFTILNWPATLTVLRVRLNNPTGGKFFDIIGGQNRIIHPTLIDKIYVESSPGIPGGHADIISGDAKFLCETCGGGQWGFSNPPRFSQLLGEQTSIDAATVGLVGPESVTASDKLSAASTKNMITNIPANTMIRIKGDATPLLNSSVGNITEFTWKMKAGADEFSQEKFQGSENQGQWKWDTGWIFHRHTSPVTFAPQVLAVGPVGQIVFFNVQYFVIPNK